MEEERNEGEEEGERRRKIMNRRGLGWEIGKSQRGVEIWRRGRRG